MIKMKCKTQISVTPAYKKLMQSIRMMKDSRIEVGFFEDSIYSPDDVSPDTGRPHSAAMNSYPVAQVAYDNNFGYVFQGKMIRRPFFDMAVQRFKQKRGREFVRKQLQEILQGNIPVVSAYRNIGGYMQELIQHFISEYPGGRVSSITELEKGHDAPLVWSGKMHDSVTYQISLTNSMAAVSN